MCGQIMCEFLVEDMYVWILIAVVVALVVMSTYTTQEEFTNVDYNTALAQRQGLQFEGERRYNPLARLQGSVSLDPDQVDDAFRQAIPTATSGSASLQTLLGSISLGSYALPSGGTGVEQTGAVREKVAFCESQKTVTCDLLKDPRFAECGFCHDKGVNSEGKPHRGGMYISSDDQIRANEVAVATGVPAQYKPTIGTCDPKNFTLVSELCEVREKQIQCEKAGAASAGNACGQCYGSAPPGSNGLVYVGPKPRTYTATLWVSHPGMHSSVGGGFTVKFPNGSVVSLPPSSKALLDPKQLTVDIQEGDTLDITLFGAPPVWCGWLSSPDGNRVVSLNVGMQYISFFTIAGDKNSGVINKVLESSPIWNSWKTTIPNSVLWYMRRGAGAITNAWYGVSLGEQGKDVTAIVKGMVADGQSVPVTNEVFRGDPAPGTYKHIWITQDNGNVIIAGEGQGVSIDNFIENVNMTMIVPATLVDPTLSSDFANCRTGPLVFTEAGAGLMGANSCFKPDGSFNPSVYCIQQLWMGAGGTTAGTKYPKTDAAAAALVGTMKMDAVVEKFNNEVNIALYGVDSNGAPQDFPTVKKFALEYFGRSMSNPCDGPTAAKGPHSAECLDSLWKAVGCSANGFLAPLTNKRSADDANRIGSVTNIRAAYQHIFNRAHDSTHFINQADAMKSCYGVNIQAPPNDTGKCPLRPEVFQPAIGYTSTQANAASVCAKYGARVATLAELENAQRMGADWCSSGWVSDHDQPKYPITTSTGQGCGNGSPGIKEWNPGNVASVNCYGKKPMKTPDIMPFNQSQWNAPNAFSLSQHLGCFGDTGNRALPNQRADVSFTGNGLDGILACQNAAIASGDNLFGLQCSGPPSSNCNAAGRAQCFTGKNVDYAKYGPRQRCGPLGDAWTNQVYSIGDSNTMSLPNIPGVWAWYDGTDPNNDGNAPANGTTVSLWRDKSGNNNDMKSQVAGVYQNRSIVFTKSWYRSTKPAPYPIDVYVVVRVNNPNVANDIIGLGDLNRDNFNSLTLSEYTASTWHNGSTYFQRTPSARANQRESSTGFLLMRWSIANNNFNIYRNGVKIMETSAYTWSSASPYLNLGERYYTTTGNNLHGAISEVVVYNRQLQDTERQRVEGYLTKKWGM